MTINQLANLAFPIIFAQEGNYSSVNKNDNGALSIGKIQWHASRALSLMKRIINEDSDSQSIIGSTLYAEILNPSTTWANRIVSEFEAKKLSELLDREVSRKIQDSLALSDICSYISVALNMGLLDNQALIFFADLYNQSPKLAKETLNIASVKCGSTAYVNLDILYAESLKTYAKYSNRRTAVYNKCKDTAVTYVIKSDTVVSQPQKSVNASVIQKDTSIQIPDLSSYKGNSIVDGLKSVGYNSGFAFRAKLYASLKLGGTYTGSAEQNILLLKALR